MKAYHPYVFDQADRRFIGQFEAMYQAEAQQHFDSWHQDDLSNLTKRICLDLLHSYNFDRVLDVGCGKGAFTGQLKKQNNKVVAVDLSETALHVARGRYPDIEFVLADVSAPSFDLSTLGAGFDLVVCMETLSYVQDWRGLLARFARVGRYALVALFVPADPIGFVKSSADLVESFATSFNVIDDIILGHRQQIVLFGESK